MRKYKCLSKDQWFHSGYSISPIRNEDQELIRIWRNEQLVILRQKNIIEQESQEKYFNTIVAGLFDAEFPNQLLFSFFEKDVFIGYGGLVHIDWESKNAEVSFLTETARTNTRELFDADLKAFIQLMFDVAFTELDFLKLHTTVYEIRQDYISIISEMGFVEEGKLKDHVMINGALKNLHIYSYFNRNKQL